MLTVDEVDAAPAPVATADKVSFWKITFKRDAPQTGGNPMGFGTLSLYDDRLAFSGEPANVGTLVSTVAHGLKAVDRVWRFDDIERIQNPAWWFAHGNCHMIIITLTDGSSFGFSPALPAWSKAQRTRNVEILDQLWQGLHKRFKAAKNIVEVDELAAKQRVLGLAPASDYVLLLAPVAEPGARREKVQLDFGVLASAVTIKSTGLQSVEGRRYRLNGRVYTDIASLHGEVLRKVSNDVCIRRDIYGGPVLDVYTSIPTFDVYDREWDGWKHEYLLFDGQDVDLVVARGGYCMASIEVYHRLRRAQAALRPWLELAGIPDASVQWTGAGA